MENNGKKTIVTAYADDVTIFITTQSDIPKIQEAIDNYTAASGAKINIAKSKAMPVGPWNTQINVMNIPYYSEVKILGTYFTNTIRQSTTSSWNTITQKLRARAKEAYSRELSLANRILYVQNILLAQTWYTSQIFPITSTCIRQINTAITWFIWKGNIFRIPLSTLQLQKHQGGWGLTNIAAKSRTLLYYRLQKQGQNTGSFTANWLKRWNLLKRSHNPPNINKIPEKLEYLQIHNYDSAYITEQQSTESNMKYKRRIYKTLTYILTPRTNNPVLRVTKIWPNIEWDTIWRNLHMTPISETSKTIWYGAIHDIIPTRARLHKIQLAHTNICENCKQTDTLQHRLTECGEGLRMWIWTQKRTAIMLRTEPKHISADWLLHPTIQLWPPQRQRATLWTLANYVVYRLQQQRSLTLQDYFDFLRRSKWKLYHTRNRENTVGNYVSVLTDDT
jgi:hypothetical protein